jgi:hypothetical protein
MNPNMAHSHEPDEQGSPHARAIQGNIFGAKEESTFGLHKKSSSAWIIE